MLEAILFPLQTFDPGGIRCFLCERKERFLRKRRDYYDLFTISPLTTATRLPYFFAAAILFRVATLAISMSHEKALKKDSAVE